ncbi:hypothetical protein N4304_13905, partial [Staphylococcus aureus]|uniref:hypothetical protein n=1 Tax=Staphylococcus aureus TaxID=1280 RepID=UPI0021B0BE60
MSLIVTGILSSLAPFWAFVPILHISMDLSFDIGSVSLGMWLAFFLYKMWLALLLYLETVYASLLFIILILPIDVYHDGSSSV